MRASHNYWTNTVKAVFVAINKSVTALNHRGKDFTLSSRSWTLFIELLGKKGSSLLIRNFPSEMNLFSFRTAIAHFLFLFHFHEVNWRDAKARALNWQVQIRPKRCLRP